MMKKKLGIHFTHILDICNAFCRRSHRTNMRFGVISGRALFSRDSSGKLVQAVALRRAAETLAPA